LLLVAGGSAAFLAARSPQAAGPRAGQLFDIDGDAKLQRVGRDDVIVPADLARKMGLQIATIPDRVRPIQLPPLQGVLAADSEHLARVRARFAGEVMSIGADLEIPARSALSSFTPSGIRVGDTVHKGDLLAVVLSKDLGEKKSELVDSLSKLRADEAVLRRLREGQADGSIPARSVWDAERTVEADRVAAARAERTLRAWRLTDDEISEVRAEADGLSVPETKAGTRRIDPNRWSRVEVRATANGVILEKNVAVGDIVDTAADLFKIGDLSHLIVWAHLYEEDLPLVQALPRPVRWTVTVPSRPGLALQGTLDQIGAVIDPNQHTALVTGRVENPRGLLKIGQFVTVSIETPAPSGEIELPVDAVLEDGSRSVTFLQSDSTALRFVAIPVRVTRRFRDAVCIRAGEGLKPGDRVVTAGALLLRDAMGALPAQRP